ncbi:MAG TPA: glycosyltransferase family 1 protein [Bryobacteraceae bacterium]|nr:glycosyltransferase family 1 protein [Bryobacteraceae bacterium]
MRICVDATSLLLRSAGVKNYIYHWIRALQLHAPELQVSAFPLIQDIGDLNHERSVASRAGTIARIGLLHATNVLGGPLMNWAAGDADVFHASNQVHKPPRGKLLTATLYDMTCLLMPENHTAANVRAERNYAEHVLKRANGLIAISEHTKRDTVRLLGICDSKISVVYPGVPDVYFRDLSDEVRRVKHSLKLTKPYALIVGTIEPRKNVDMLLDAWAKLPRDIREAWELIVAGPEGWAHSKTLARLRSAPDGVRYLGYVAERDLPALTAGSDLFVYPSFYEGFGFPAAQAMAAGVPLITSNVSSLPEVAQDAGILIDPKSVEGLRAALLQAITSPVKRAEMSRRGREIAREYTWQQAARKSAFFFENLG